jgi:hypothetical protein
MDIIIAGKKMISSKQIAEVWKCRPYTVQIHCHKNHIPGAVLLAGTWLIPEDAADPRLPRGRPKKENEYIK